MKIIVFLSLVIIAAVCGGLYGAFHDQISYTVSPEFFTKFRFKTQQIDASYQGRVGAAVIGWRNTWTIGMILGGILAMVGFIHVDYKKMFRVTLQAIGIAIGIAFIFAVLGLLFGYLFNTPYKGQGRLPDGILFPKQFVIVSTMHNFSNVGGVVGMFCGIYWQVFSRKRLLEEVSFED